MNGEESTIIGEYYYPSSRNNRLISLSWISNAAFSLLLDGYWNIWKEN